MSHQVFKLKVLRHNNDETIIEQDGIYGDDTLEKVKYKLTQTLDLPNHNEYCFFIQRQHKVEDLPELYHTLTKGKPYLSMKQFNTFCRNYNIESEIQKEDNASMYTQNGYSIDVFVELLEKYKGKFLVDEPFDLPFYACDKTVNPLKNKRIYNSGKPSQRNKQLLFEINGIHKDTIIAVHMEECANYVKESNDNLNMDDMMEAYYPNAIKHVEDQTIRHDNGFIDKHHTLYHSHSKEEVGLTPLIQYVTFVYKNKNPFLFPQEIFFKKVHSKKDFPLISLSDGTTREGVLRLFTNDKKDIHGRKYPYLPKNKTISVLKNFQKKECVSLYHVIEIQSQRLHVYIDIDTQGNLFFTITQMERMSISQDIESLCAGVLNKMIAILNKTIDPAKVIYKEVEEFSTHDMITILDIQYVMRLKNMNLENLDSIMKYFSGIFHIQPSKTNDKNMVLTYKRVSNYDKMEDQMATFIRLFNTREIYIKSGFDKMKQYFNQDEEKTRAYINQQLSLLQMQEDYEGVSKNKFNRIKNNPGVLLEFVFDNNTNQYKILMSNINHFKHKDFISVYLLNLLYMLHNDEASQKESIDSLFQGFIHEKSAQDGDNDDIRELEIERENDTPSPFEEEDDRFGPIGDSDEESLPNVMELSDDEEEDNQSFPSVANLSDTEEEREEEDEEDDDEGVSVVSLGDTEDEGDSEEDEPVGGAKHSEKFKIRNPNPLSGRIAKHQPLLHPHVKNAMYPGYSSICQYSTSIKRVPVLLTQKDKDNLDNKGYTFKDDEIVEYSTNPSEEKYYYICPEYWNLRDNIPVKKEDVDKDTLIDHSKSFTDLNKKYVLKISDKYKYPGFIDKGKNKHGLFMPCCMTKKGADYHARIKEAEHQMKAIRDSGLTDQDDILTFLKDMKTTSKQGMLTDYIHKDKFPLDLGRYGMIQESMMNFLGAHKKNGPFLYRKGVLRKGNQGDQQKSFLGCLAVLFLKKNSPSVDDIVTKIKESITLDNILSFHNGNIPTLFHKEEELESVDIDNYKHTNLYALFQSHVSRESILKQFKIIINGYEHFMRYLEKEHGENEVIDYYYLWDIVSSGILDEHSENEPLNMIVLKETQNKEQQTTIHLICPSPGFAKKQYDLSKRCILIYQKEKYFEPLIQSDMTPQERVHKKYTENPFFTSENNESLIQSLTKILSNASDKCNVTHDKTMNVHDFVKYFGKVIQKDYTNCIQILNFDNKIVGICLDDTYIPLKPSSMIQNLSWLNLDLMHDGIWKSYEDTIQSLADFDKRSNFKMNCSAKYKVVEDNTIVGVMTKTRFFVKVIHQSLDSVNDSLKVEKGYDMVEMNEEAFVEKDRPLSGDVEDKQIRNLKLEKMFYQGFLNTMRFQLQNYENYNTKQRLETLLRSKDSFENKYNQVYAIVSEFAGKYIHFFHDYGDEELLTMLQDEISLCGNETSPYCNFVDSEHMKLLIPRYNLYNQENNEEKYISSLTFDLLMNVTVQRQLIEKGHGYIYDDVSYRIKKNEMILLKKNVLEYFNQLAKKSSSYIHHDVYENLQPDKIIEITNDEEKEERSIMNEMENSEFNVSEVKNDTTRMNTIVEEELYDTMKEIESDSDNESTESYSESTESDSESTESDSESVESDSESTESGNESSESESDSETEKNDEMDANRLLMNQIEDDEENNKDDRKSETSNESESNSESKSETSNESENKSESSNESESKSESSNESESENKIESERKSESNSESSNESESERKSEKKSESSNESESESNSESEKTEEYTLQELPKNEDRIVLEFQKPQTKVVLKISDIVKKQSSQHQNQKEDARISSKINNIFIKNVTRRPNIPKMSVEIQKDRLKQQYDMLRQENCIQLNNLTSKWATYFPKGSRELSVKKALTKDCNYLILMYIMKTYHLSLFQTINKYTIQKLLAHYYKEYFEDEKFSKKIFEKWKAEGKEMMVEQWNAKTDLETILFDENYVLTTTDVCLLSFHLKLPIIIIHQSSNPSLKISHFAINNENNKAFFFIRPTKNNSSNNGEIIFHLFYCKNSFQFSLDIFEDENAKMKSMKTMITQGGFVHFRNYLNS